VASRSAMSRESALGLGAEQVFANSLELPYCDGYVVATPIPSLAQEAKKLIPRGVPIFSEKTLCPTMEQAKELATAGGEGLIFVMHKWEYHSGIQTLRAIVDSGRIGKTELVSCCHYGWKTGTPDGDVLTVWAIHDLTIVRRIIGAIPAPAFSLIGRKEAVPVSLWAVLGEGPRAILSVDWRHPSSRRSVSVHGTKGTALLSDSYADHVLIRDNSGDECVALDKTMPLYEELKEFVEYLQGGPPPRCGLEQAREVALALDALRKADRSTG